jgi:hypothetical protein
MKNVFKPNILIVNKLLHSLCLVLAGAQMVAPSTARAFWFGSNKQEPVQYNSVPATAKAILSAQGVATLRLNNIIADDPASCRQAYGNALNNLGVQLAQSNVDLETDCKTVFYQYASGGSVINALSDGSRGYSSTVTISVSCIKRDFAEKHYLRAQRGCEEQPRPECFNPEFLNYLKTIQSTQTFHVNSERLCRL